MFMFNFSHIDILWIIGQYNSFDIDKCNDIPQIYFSP